MQIFGIELYMIHYKSHSQTFFSSFGAIGVRERVARDGAIARVVDHTEVASRGGAGSNADGVESAAVGRMS